MFKPSVPLGKQLFPVSRCTPRGAGCPGVLRPAACSVRSPALSPPMEGTGTGSGPGTRVGEKLLVRRRALPGTGLEGTRPAGGHGPGAAVRQAMALTAAWAAERGRAARSVRPAPPPLLARAVPGDIPDRAHIARAVPPTRLGPSSYVSAVCVVMFVEPWNGLAGRHLKDRLLPNPLLWAGTPRFG